MHSVLPINREPGLGISRGAHGRLGMPRRFFADLRRCTGSRARQGDARDQRMAGEARAGLAKARLWCGENLVDTRKIYQYAE